jgi:DNA-binding LytR/AlgR family response regulator
MNVLIVEDESLAARRLERMLSAEDMNILAKLGSVSSAIEWFKNNEHPELIFLDIQLSDGLSFEIFDNVEVKSHIIFTTAFDEYALKAFKLNSIDYLLKPIDSEELYTAIDKYRLFNKSDNKTLSKEQLEQISLLLNSPQKQYKERFTVRIGAHIHTIPSTDIECFYSENKASYLYTKTGHNYLIDYSLEQIEELIDPSIFHRVSRKYILNIDFIKDIIAYSNSRLKVKLTAYKEDEIIVSRERVKMFKQWLD